MSYLTYLHSCNIFQTANQHLTPHQNYPYIITAIVVRMCDLIIITCHPSSLKPKLHFSFNPCCCWLLFVPLSYRPECIPTSSMNPLNLTWPTLVYNATSYSSFSSLKYCLKIYRVLMSLPQTQWATYKQDSLLWWLLGKVRKEKFLHVDSQFSLILKWLLFDSRKGQVLIWGVLYGLCWSVWLIRQCTSCCNEPLYQVRQTFSTTLRSYEGSLFSYMISRTFYYLFWKY